MADNAIASIILRGALPRESMHKAADPSAALKIARGIFESYAFSVRVFAFNKNVLDTWQILLESFVGTLGRKMVVNSVINNLISPEGKSADAYVLELMAVEESQ